MKYRSCLFASTLGLALSALVSCTANTAAAPNGAQGSANGEEGLGQAEASLTSVPSGVLCIRIAVTGSSAVVRSIPVTSGASTASVPLGALSPGAILVSALAYNAACVASGSPAADPTWMSDPVAATVIAGVTTQIPLVLRPIPQATGVVSFEQPAISIAAGANTSYAVLADGTLRAWGDNTSLQYGSTQARSLTPVAVPGITGAVAVAAGDAYACVLFSNKTVKCFGADDANQLAIPATSTPQPPTLVAGLTAIKISVAGKMSCAQQVDGSLVCWGSNQSPGGGSFIGPNLSPTYSGPAIDIAAAATGSYFIGPAGQTYCVAQESGGGMCSNTTTTATTRVFGGRWGACALRADGQVWCWGKDVQGFGASTLVEPNALIPGVSDVATMGINRTDGTHACLALTSGDVECSGANDSGQLGNGTTVPSTSYAPTLGVSQVVELAAGVRHTCARTVSGAVYCWGSNGSGQVGDGTVDNRFRAVPVAAW